MELATSESLTKGGLERLSSRTWRIYSKWIFWAPWRMKVYLHVGVQGYVRRFTRSLLGSETGSGMSATKMLQDEDHTAPFSKGRGQALQLPGMETK